MSKDEYMNLYNSVKDRLNDEFGYYLFIVIDNTLNINKMETVVEKMGYVTKRMTEFGPGRTYSDIFYDGKIIGYIECSPFPSITISRRYRTKHARKIAENENVIAPIKSVHRILQWHDVEGKLHKLAGGETLLHFKHLDISIYEAMEMLKSCGFTKKHIEEFKKEDGRTSKEIKEMFK